MTWMKTTLSLRSIGAENEENQGMTHSVKNDSLMPYTTYRLSSFFSQANHDLCMRKWPSKSHPAAQSYAHKHPHGIYNVSKIKIFGSA
jgi:hypothetical protein